MSRSSGAALRAGTVACVAAAVATPLLRRRLRIPAPVTIAACASGPLGVAVLRPPSRPRAVAAFALQMWAFTLVHELPYDDPERLRRRLRVDYPIAIDRALGRGALPSVRLQGALARRERVGSVDRALSWVHWIWFLEPYAALALILGRHGERFPRAAGRLAATFDLGCALYFLVPTAPPWWASEQGLSGEEVRRIMTGVGEETWGRAWPAMYRAVGDGNPWAAMPSLHFAVALMVAVLLAETGPVAGALGWGYALALGFALVYLGEHYLTDLAAGALLVAAVRLCEPLVAPLLTRAGELLRPLEAR
ncbi:MAG: phosphatase PAP2 family protein [Solirubrobacterales bacterium]